MLLFAKNSYLKTYTGHPASIHWSVLTLMSILPCRLLGLGRVLESLLSASPTSSLSPKISRRYWAIFFCCWMLQWFSMDRITGYLEREKHTFIRINWIKPWTLKCLEWSQWTEDWSAHFSVITFHTLLPFLTSNQERKGTFWEIQLPEHPFTSAAWCVVEDYVCVRACDLI